jgi:hypothetical protein
MDLKVPKSDVNIQNNPFLILGYGVNAYFEIIDSLFRMMFVVTLAFLPVMSIYSSNTLNALADRPKAFLNIWSLGNYGGSSVICKRSMLREGQMNF